MQSALSVLTRSTKDLMRNPHFANLAFYLYGNIMSSILFGQVSIANVSRAFLYAFLQSAVFSLTIATLSTVIPVWPALLCPYTFSFSLSSNLVVQISIFLQLQYVLDTYAIYLFLNNLKSISLLHHIAFNQVYQNYLLY